MPTGGPSNTIAFPASPELLVVDPGGRQTTISLRPFPFHVGRAPDSNLVLHDSRVSRDHARFSRVNGQYVIEDLDSRHGVWLNGERIHGSRVLTGGERIEFGVPDGYRLYFLPVPVAMAATPTATLVSARPATSLEKLRAVLEIGRSLQSSFSVADVLDSVVDAAVAVIGAERGFLLLFGERGRELEVRTARSRGGTNLPASDLRVPRALIRRALETRHDLFSMSFDPHAATGELPSGTIADLELRSVCCLPLVRVNLGSAPRTSETEADSVGVLYMDSRAGTVDLANGNRELLQTLAIEASTVLESARLLADDRARQHMEEELAVARRIQRSLLPRQVPTSGWLRAEGSSSACHEVGGDYFDLVRRAPDLWSMVVADVAGKGVSAALVASFLQGAFLAAAPDGGIGDLLGRINEFLADRAAEARYATVFYATLECSGLLTYANAGHCEPLLVSGGTVVSLAATSVPVGLVPVGTFAVEARRIVPGDRLVLYTDGVTEAANGKGEFFGIARLREAVLGAAGGSCREIHETVLTRVREFIGGAEQHDDVTLVVLEYAGTA